MNQAFRTTKWTQSRAHQELMRAIDEQWPGALPPDWEQLSPYQLRVFKCADLASKIRQAHARKQLLEAGHD